MLSPDDNFKSATNCGAVHLRETKGRGVGVVVDALARRQTQAGQIVVSGVARESILLLEIECSADAVDAVEVADATVAAISERRVHEVDGAVALPQHPLAPALGQAIRSLISQSRQRFVAILVLVRLFLQ